MSCLAQPGKRGVVGGPFLGPPCRRAGAPRRRTGPPGQRTKGGHTANLATRCGCVAWRACAASADVVHDAIELWEQRDEMSRRCTAYDTGPARSEIEPGPRIAGLQDSRIAGLQDCRIAGSSRTAVWGAGTQIPAPCHACRAWAADSAVPAARRGPRRRRQTLRARWARCGCWSPRGRSLVCRSRHCLQLEL